MSKGVIALFDWHKEMGLITVADGGEKLPFTRVDVRSGISGAAQLNAGQDVEFEIVEVQGERRAVNILIPAREVGDGPGSGRQGD